MKKLAKPQLVAGILRPHAKRPNQPPNLALSQLDLLYLSDYEKEEAEALPSPLLPTPDG